MSGCATFETLLAVRADASLNPTEAAQLEAHLAACERCRAVADTLPPASETRIQTDDPELPLVSATAYCFGDEIARGGMGRIRDARDLRIGRPVAIKELLDGTDELASRFEREARLTARLQHPGIVPIYEIGKWSEGKPFYAMRKVPGATLRDALRQTRSLTERLTLLPALITAAEAVAYAHSMRVIHRDLTPSNIIVGHHGETVVIDWGLAKDVSEPEDTPLKSPTDCRPPGSERLTAVGAVIGTPAYMPPEQARGEAVDERADVYALGAILFQVLTGRQPAATAPEQVGVSPAVRDASSGKSERRVRSTEKGKSPGSARARIRQLIAAAEPRTPAALAAIVEKAMEPEVGNRYASVMDFVNEVRRFQKGNLVAAYHYSLGERLWMLVGRHRVAVAAAVALAAILAGIGQGALRGVLAARREAEMRAAAFLVERGRQELAAKTPSHALPFLSQAARLGYDGEDLPTLLSAASRAVRTLSRTVTVDASISLGRINPDGSTFVTAGSDLDARLWSTLDGSPIADLGGHPGPPIVLQFNSSGDLLVTASPCREALDHPCEHELQIWDAHTGRRINTLHVGSTVHGARFVSNSELLISTDASALRWDVRHASARVERVFHAHGLVLAGGTGAAPQSTSIEERVVEDLASDEAEYVQLSAKDPRALEFRRLPDGSMIQAAVLDHPIHSARYAESNRKVLVLFENGEVRLIRRAGLVEEDSWDLHQDQALDARLLPKGRLLTLGRDGRLNVFENDRGRILELATPGRTRLFSWASQGRLLVITQSGDGLVFDATGNLVGSQKSDDPWAAAAFDGSGDSVWLAGESGTLGKWDISTNVVQMTGRATAGVRIVAADGVGTFLALDGRIIDSKGIVVGAITGRLEVVKDRDVLSLASRPGYVFDRPLVWNRNGGLRASALPSFDFPGAVHYDLSDDGGRLAHAFGRRLSLLSVETGLEAWSAPLVSEASTVAFAPGSHEVMTRETGDRVSVWDLGGRRRFAVTVAPSRITGVEWNPDGRRLLVSTSDGFVRLLDSWRGTQLDIYGPESEAPSMLALSPDGGSVAMAIAERVVLWNIGRNEAGRDQLATWIARVPEAARDEGVEHTHVARIDDARRDWNLALKNMIRGNHLAAARLCQLADGFSPKSTYLLCAAMSYGIAGYRAASTQILREYLGNLGRFAAWPAPASAQKATVGANECRTPPLPPEHFTAPEQIAHVSTEAPVRAAAAATKDGLLLAVYAADDETSSQLHGAAIAAEKAPPDVITLGVDAMREPAIVTDRSGRFYLALIATELAGRRSGVWLARSDNGRDWAASVLVSSSTSACSPSSPCFARPKVVVGPARELPGIQGSSGAEVVYVIYSNLRTGTLEASHSYDGGRTFSPGVNAALGGYADAQVTASGKLHLVFAKSTPEVGGNQEGGVFYTNSADFGVSFAQPARVSSAFPSGTSDRRVSPKILVDMSRRTLYAAYVIQKDPWASDVLLASSTDGGVSWFARKVNEDSSCATHDAAAAALDPGTGEVHVAWLERGTDDVQLVYARCQPGVSTCSKNERVGDSVPRAPPTGQSASRCVGDCISMTVDSELGRLHAVWVQPDKDHASQVMHASASLR